jgi:16S rRNA (guanine(527)-N(7))-methyltransferase RsmG
MELEPALVHDFERAAASPGAAPYLALLQGPLQTYAAVLHQWAATMSLVSRKDRDHLATRHLLPALRAGPVMAALPRRYVIDLGSGAGLPGIPLALSLPDSLFSLVESRRRRVAFLRHVVRALRLANVEVVHARFERWTPSAAADCILSRGVRLSPDLLQAAARVLAPHGTLLAFGVLSSGEGSGRMCLWSPGPRPDAARVTVNRRWHDGAGGPRQAAAHGGCPSALS